MLGGAGGDVMFGETGNDTLDGGTENDFLNGGGGTDVLLGGAGNDRLDGGGSFGGGPDLLTGGPGNDTFVYAKDYRATTITDFDAAPGESDLFDFSGTKVHSFKDLLTHISQSAGGLTFDFGNGDVLSVPGATSSELTPNIVTFSEADPVGGAFIFNPKFGTNGIDPAALDNGGFVIAHMVTLAAGVDIEATLFNPDSSEGATIVVNSTPSGFGSISTPVVSASLPGGKFVVAWESNDGEVPGGNVGYRARIFNDDGTPVGPDFVVNNTDPQSSSRVLHDIVPTHDADGNPNGGFVVEWLDGFIPSNTPGVSLPTYRVRIFDASGNPVGSDFNDGTLPDNSGGLLLKNGDGVRWTVVNIGTDALPDQRIYASLNNGDYHDISLVTAFGNSGNLAVDLAGRRLVGDIHATELADGRVLFHWTFARNIFEGEQNGQHYGSYTTGIDAVILNPDLTGVTLAGTPYSDVVGPGPGLVGSGYDDHIYGLAGDDILVGLAGPDYLDGGPGSDTANYELSLQGIKVDLADGLPEHGGHAEGDVLVSIENIVGTYYDDIISGEVGPSTDRLYGGWGNDTITLRGTGGGEAHGGPGDDDINLVGSGATAYGDDGREIFSVVGNSNTVYGGNDSDIVWVSGNFNTIFSEAGKDIIQIFAPSTASGNVLAGGADDDTIIDGGSGGNIFYGGDGSDKIDAGDGNDTIYDDTTTASPDKIDAGAGDDIIYTMGGGDTIDGGPGNDTLFLQYGASTAAIVVTLGDPDVFTLIGGDGTRFIHIEDLQFTGGSGDDKVTVLTSTGKTLEGGGGNDELRTGDGNDILYGGTGNDQLYAGAGNDTVIGNAGNDLLEGGDGNDYLYGDFSYEPFGNDILHGGNGDDYLYDPGGNNELDGGDGFDIVDLSGSAGGVYASLADAQVFLASGGLGFASGFNAAIVVATDTIHNVERVFGTQFDDQYFGTAADEMFAPNTGNDSVFGGGGHDTAEYSTAGGAIYADLGAQFVKETLDADATDIATAVFVSTDHVEGISNVYGSSFSDRIVGTAGDNLIRPDQGSDVIDALGGIDTVDYSTIPGPVHVDLAAGTADKFYIFFSEDGSTAVTLVGTDSILGFEDIIGTRYDDILLGTDGDNTFRGGGGVDTLDGRGGIDTVIYGGNIANYAVTYDGATDTFTVADKRAGAPDGKETDKGFETFVFADAVMSASQMQGYAAASIIGAAMDGYIAGATVFGDADGDGVLDLQRHPTTTDAAGGYVLVGGSGPIVLSAEPISPRVCHLAAS